MISIHDDTADDILVLHDDTADDILVCYTMILSG